MSSSPNPSMIHLLPTPSLEWGALQNSYWLKNVCRGRRERRKKKKKRGWEMPAFPSSSYTWGVKMELCDTMVKWISPHCPHTPLTCCSATISAPSAPPPTPHTHPGLCSAHLPHLQCNLLSKLKLGSGLDPHCSSRHLPLTSSKVPMKHVHSVVSRTNRFTWLSRQLNTL